MTLLVAVQEASDICFHGHLWNELPAGLDALDRFTAAVAGFLESHP